MTLARRAAQSYYSLRRDQCGNARHPRPPRLNGMGRACISDGAVIQRRFSCLALVLSALASSACGTDPEPPERPTHDDLYAFAGGCFALDATEPGESFPRFLRATLDGSGYTFSSDYPGSQPARFYLEPADLGTYLLYDEGRRYVVSEGGSLERHEKLQSDISLIDDTYVSGAEWEVMPSVNDAERLQLRHRKTGHYLTADGTLTEDENAAAVIALHPREGCAAFPELSLDATGSVTRTTFDDGDLYGIVDAHSHMLTNFGFGGGGIFHGAPFHRLGVEHALGDCTQFHGYEGRKDMLGFAFDQGNMGNFDTETFLPALLFGVLPEFNHEPAGYPKFTDWPSAPFSSTHQTQYYKWLERAWMGGLRLVVQHATGNSAMCDLIAGQEIQPVRYSCNDMVSVDRQLAEAYNLERYIDAHAGGPGRGWFRIVKTPAEARAVIEEGKLAVVLGIEISNVFDCFLVPQEGFPTCDDAFIRAQLDRYYDLGVRVMFPVHKYDNAFSPGDGHRAISEIGNFANSGHWSSYGLDCPGVPVVFDRGNVNFGGLNMPREEYVSTPPNDMSGFSEEPLETILPFADKLQEPALEGDYCQTFGLTDQGRTLLTEMMARGMIIDIDHLPQWSYFETFEILEAADYPASATHGSEYEGRIYEIGGISKFNFGRCEDPARPGAMADSLNARVERIEAAGGYPAAGFGFDLNGLAGGPGPRFGDRSECEAEQTNPITYPFDSYGGDVTFQEPKIAERTLDFNTEGMATIALMPELIEDARRTGVTDEELEPLFRSAEGWLRMWERAESRSKALR